MQILLFYFVHGFLLLPKRLMITSDTLEAESLEGRMVFSRSSQAYMYFVQCHSFGILLLSSFILKSALF